MLFMSSRNRCRISGLAPLCLLRNNPLGSVSHRNVADARREFKLWLKDCRTPMVKQEDLIVATLGECTVRSPLAAKSARASHFVSDARRIRYDIQVPAGSAEESELSFEQAGPREKIFFDPVRTTVAVVTCGGLSPGLNNVIRSAFEELTENYGVERVLGIRNGYLGMNPEAGLEPVLLTREFIGQIDQVGGTVLGSSRGAQEHSVKARFLASHGVDILLCLGGDGTQRGANCLREELEKQGLPIAVIGIPKTIDNDIPFVRQTFGFATALEKSSEVIKGAHVEARGAPNGIGLVKLMGRDAGFIAAGATVVSQEVNFTLVPEVKFPLDGENGLLAMLEKRLERRGHAVIVVAEGAGQHLLARAEERRALERRGYVGDNRAIRAKGYGRSVCGAKSEHALSVDGDNAGRLLDNNGNLGRQVRDRPDADGLQKPGCDRRLDLDRCRRTEGDGEPSRVSSASRAHMAPDG